MVLVIGEMADLSFDLVVLYFNGNKLLSCLAQNHLINKKIMRVIDRQNEIGFIQNIFNAEIRILDFSFRALDLPFFLRKIEIQLFIPHVFY